MKYEQPAPRKRVNLTVREDIMAEARALGLNTSRAAEAGIEAAVREEKGRRWREENREARSKAMKLGDMSRLHWPMIMSIGVRLIGLSQAWSLTAFQKR